MAQIVYFKQGVSVFPDCGYGTNGTCTRTIEDANLYLAMIGIKKPAIFLQSCAYFFKTGGQGQKLRMPFFVKVGTSSTITRRFMRHCKLLVKASLKKEAEDRLTKKAKEAAANIVSKQDRLLRNKAEGLTKKAAAAAAPTPSAAASAPADAAPEAMELDM